MFYAARYLRREEVSLSLSVPARVFSRLRMIYDARSTRARVQAARVEYTRRATATYAIEDASRTRPGRATRLRELSFSTATNAEMQRTARGPSWHRPPQNKSIQEAAEDDIFQTVGQPVPLLTHLARGLVFPRPRSMRGVAASLSSSWLRAPRRSAVLFRERWAASVKRPFSGKF